MRTPDFREMAVADLDDDPEIGPPANGMLEKIAIFALVVLPVAGFLSGLLVRGCLIGACG